MHARGRAASGTVRRSETRPAWLVTAAVALGAAVAYLFVSLNQAFESSPDGGVTSFPPLGRDFPVAEAQQPASAHAETKDEPPGQISAPLPGLSGAIGDPELRRAIEKAVGDDGEHLAVSTRRISDGRSASFNGDYRYYAASTFKLAVLYEAELRHFRGELEYDDRLFISDEDAAEDLGTSGYLEFEDDGSISIAHLLEAMITVSDNSSAVALMHEFGTGNIDATLRGLGIEDMTVNKVELWTTADDLARLMAAIYAGEGVGPEERGHMRELLLAQSIRTGIPGVLADEIESGLRVGNKTGTWEGAQHDVAFVESEEGAYVVAVLTDGSWEGWRALERVVRDIHQKFSQTP